MQEPRQTDPWGRYEVRTLPRGYIHPLQLADLRQALVEADVRVGRLSRSGAYPKWWNGPLEKVVLHVHRYGDAESRNWGPHEPWEQFWLTVNGCPGDLRQIVRNALLAVGLPRAIAWIADAEFRGEAWRASSHRLEIGWKDGRLVFTEDRSHGSLAFTESRTGSQPWSP